MGIYAIRLLTSPAATANTISAARDTKAARKARTPERVEAAKAPLAPSPGDTRPTAKRRRASARKSAWQNCFELKGQALSGETERATAMRGRGATEASEV